MKIGKRIFFLGSEDNFSFIGEKFPEPSDQTILNFLWGKLYRNRKKLPVYVDAAAESFANADKRPLKVYFQDEARFGRMQNPASCWVPHRPIALRLILLSILWEHLREKYLSNGFWSTMDEPEYDWAHALFDV